jgi:hypothetical protein
MMRTVRRAALAASLALAASAASLAAQTPVQKEGTLLKEKVVTVGPVVGIAFPTGDFGDVVGTGFMLAGQGTYGYKGKVTFLGEVGVTIFGGDDTIIDGQEVDVDGPTAIHFAAGARVPLGPVYVGGLAGYWTDVDDFDLVPLVGIHFGTFDIGARYNGLIGDGDWLTITGALHFRIR